MVAVFRQLGTAASVSEALKTSVSTLESWYAQLFSACPGMLSGPAALRGLMLCRVPHTSALVTLRGASPGDGGEPGAEGGGGFGVLEVSVEGV